MKRSRLVFLCLVLLSAFACTRPEKGVEAPTPSEQQRRAERAAAVPAQVQRHWTFLNRLRQNDAYNAIYRTRVDEQNQLGVVLSSSLGRDQVRELMERVMKEMAKEFPGEAITLDAYAPTQALRKLGTAQVDKSEVVTYTPAK